MYNTISASNHTLPQYDRTLLDKVFLTAYVSTILLLDILGNSFVLFSTIKHHAIKLDKMSVWLVQNLAVADLCSSLTVITPILSANLAGNRWILGQTLCNFVGYMKYFFLILNIFFLMSMSLNKLFRCLFPLRQLYCAHASLIKFSIGLYLLSSLQVFYMFTMDFTGRTVVMFVATQSYCTMVDPYNPNRMWFLEFYCHLFYNIIPCLVLTSSNVALLIYSCRKSSRGVKKSSIFSIIAISITFMSCTFFYSISRVVVHFDHHAISGHFLTFAYFMHLNSYWANPPVYLLTNPGFRKFTIHWVREQIFGKLQLAQNNRVSDVTIPLQSASRYRVSKSSCGSVPRYKVPQYSTQNNLRICPISPGQ